MTETSIQLNSCEVFKVFFCYVRVQCESYYYVPRWKFVLVSWRLLLTGLMKWGISKAQVSSLTPLSNVNEHYPINNMILREEDMVLACVLCFPSKQPKLRSSKPCTSLIRHIVVHDKVLFIVLLGERPLQVEKRRDKQSSHAGRRHSRKMI